MARSSALAERRVEPEWLDELPSADARAVRSRRDLRIVNAIMGNARLLAAALGRLPDGAHIADLGAGDGAVSLALARRLRTPEIEVTLVDRAPSVTAATLRAFDAAGWRTVIEKADVLQVLRDPSRRFDAIFANLFLHHFRDGALRELLALISARTTRFAACEPRRSSVALWGSRLLFFLGCNEVTRHDAVVSVRAGFAGDEISRAWPQGDWRLGEKRAGPFSHVFVANRDHG
jgi:SAM-dependent methyltransferase